MVLTVLSVNAPPVAEAGGPYTVAEGGSVELDGSGSSDPDQAADALTYEWDLDKDGQYDDATGATPTFPAAGLDGYPGASVTVGLRVTDSAGVSSTDTATVAITNVAPAVGPVVGPAGPVAAGTAVTLSAAFTDPGVVDTHAAVWDWGDKSSSAGTVTEAGGSGTASGTHTYTAAGVYTVKVTVTDKDTGAGSAEYRYVVVYDPAAGFVTGGGWINSPAGAYAPNPSLAGKATFGFVSQYKNGATVPTGDTQFQFHAAGFNFKSASYDWMVISGAKARYRGTGTLNGVGGYGFELTAWDGKVNGGGGMDRFRIKVWDKATGNVIYDNQMGAGDGADPTTALGGGSIVIHK